MTALWLLLLCLVAWPVVRELVSLAAALLVAVVVLGVLVLALQALAVAVWA